MPPRTVAIIGAVCLTIGWLLASTLTPPVAQSQARPERQPPPSPPSQTNFTERLRFRELTTAAPTAGRNPFAFATRPVESASRPAPDASDADAAEVAAEPAAPVPTGPPFSLAGIGISADERTAVLTDGQAVFIVRPGERVGPYEVVEISNDSATLVDASGVQHVLRLR